MSVIMSEIDAYKIQQIVDNGNAVQISLVEDVQTEPLSQKQLIIENVSKKLDDERKSKLCRFWMLYFKHSLPLE